MLCFLALCDAFNMDNVGQIQYRSMYIDIYSMKLVLNQGSFVHLKWLVRSCFEDRSISSIGQKVLLFIFKGLILNDEWYGPLVVYFKWVHLS